MRVIFDLKCDANVHVLKCQILLFLRAVSAGTFKFVTSFPHSANIDVGLESIYPVKENFGGVTVCVTIQRVTTGCAIGFPFSMNLSTTDGSAGTKLN